MSAKLNEFIQKLGEASNSKEELERLVELQSIAKEIEAEDSKMLAAYTQLKADYKNAVLHGGFSNTQGQSNEPESLESIVARVAKQN